MKLNDKLKKLNSYPFHMPGHKRNSDFNIPSAEIDITEIDAFDNLHNPTGIIKSIEDEIESLYNSKKSIISVNGSTCCILSAISAVCKQGDKIIIARNCHKSVYNACYINKLDVCYIEPQFNEQFGIYTNVTQQSVENAVKSNPDAVAIVITSPTYEGFVSKISADIPIIVDSAHGSHFGFCEYLPERSSGDIVINSLHKTLPCLTQCAVVHIFNERYAQDIKKYMDIYETSSPSYILMASIERCVDFLKNSNKAFSSYKALLDNFYNKIKMHKNISLLENDDITRIVVGINGYSGAEIADLLRNNYIEPEAVGINYVTLISTVCDTEKGFDMLYNALSKAEIRDAESSLIIKPSLPEKILEQYEIEDSIPIKLKLSADKISAESIFAYPPDIPLITAGEKISQQIIEYISYLTSNGVNVLSDSNLLPDYILTKAD